ncbi:unnamed protein product [Prunus brigantina]
MENIFHLLPVKQGEIKKTLFYKESYFYNNCNYTLDRISRMEVLADSVEPEPVQCLLAELDLYALGREGLLPSIQLGSLHALSILAPLCCSLLSEHSFLYLIQPPGASPGSSAPGTAVG